MTSSTSISNSRPPPGKAVSLDLSFCCSDLGAICGWNPYTSQVTVLQKAWTYFARGKHHQAAVKRLEVKKRALERQRQELLDEGVFPTTTTGTSIPSSGSGISSPPTAFGRAPPSPPPPKESKEQQWLHDLRKKLKSVYTMEELEDIQKKALATAPPSIFATPPLRAAPASRQTYQPSASRIGVKRAREETEESGGDRERQGEGEDQSGGFKREKGEGTTGSGNQQQHPSPLGAAQQRGATSSSASATLTGPRSRTSGGPPRISPVILCQFGTVLERRALQEFEKREYFVEYGDQFPGQSVQIDTVTTSEGRYLVWGIYGKIDGKIEDQIVEIKSRFVGGFHDALSEEAQLHGYLKIHGESIGKLLEVGLTKDRSLLCRMRTIRTSPSDLWSCFMLPQLKQFVNKMLYFLDSPSLQEYLVSIWHQQAKFPIFLQEWNRQCLLNAGIRSDSMSESVVRARLARECDPSRGETDEELEFEFACSGSDGVDVPSPSTRLEGSEPRREDHETSPLPCLVQNSGVISGEDGLPRQEALDHSILESTPKPTLEPTPKPTLEQMLYPDLRDSPPSAAPEEPTTMTLLDQIGTLRRTVRAQDQDVVSSASKVIKAFLEQLQQILAGSTTSKSKSIEEESSCPIPEFREAAQFPEFREKWISDLLAAPIFRSTLKGVIQETIREERKADVGLTTPSPSDLTREAIVLGRPSSPLTPPVMGMRESSEFPPPPTPLPPRPEARSEMVWPSFTPRLPLPSPPLSPVTTSSRSPTNSASPRNRSTKRRSRDSESQRLKMNQEISTTDYGLRSKRRKAAVRCNDRINPTKRSRLIHWL